MFLGAGGRSTVSRVCVGPSTPPDMGCQPPASLPWALLGCHEQLQRQRGHLHLLGPPGWRWRRVAPAHSVSPHPQWPPGSWPHRPGHPTTRLRAQNGRPGADRRMAPAPRPVQGVAARKRANWQQSPRRRLLHFNFLIGFVIWRRVGAGRSGQVAATTVQGCRVQRRVWRWKRFTFEPKGVPSIETALKQRGDAERTGRKWGESSVALTPGVSYKEKMMCSSLVFLCLHCLHYTNNPKGLNMKLYWLTILVTSSAFINATLTHI